MQQIDGSPLEKQALERLRQGDRKGFFECQDRFLKQVKESGEDHCPCKAACKYHGKCLDCVLIHRGHQDHLPVCFHGMVNQRLAAVAGLSETHLADGKGNPVS
jgi:hypothetical protein